MNTSRKFLLKWLTDTTGIKIEKIEDVGKGVHLCAALQILEKDLSSHIEKSLNKSPRTESDFLKNLKLCQSYFNNNKINVFFPIEKMCRCKVQDNLEFLQWFYKFFTEENLKKCSVVEKSLNEIENKGLCESGLKESIMELSFSNISIHDVNSTKNNKKINFVSDTSKYNKRMNETVKSYSNNIIGANLAYESLKNKKITNTTSKYINNNETSITFNTEKENKDKNGTFNVTLNNMKGKNKTYNVSYNEPSKECLNKNKDISKNIMNRWGNKGVTHKNIYQANEKNDINKNQDKTKLNLDKKDYLNSVNLSESALAKNQINVNLKSENKKYLENNSDLRETGKGYVISQNCIKCLKNELMLDDFQNKKDLLEEKIKYYDIKMQDFLKNEEAFEQKVLENERITGLERNEINNKLKDIETQLNQEKLKIEESYAMKIQNEIKELQTNFEEVEKENIDLKKFVAFLEQKILEINEESKNKEISIKSEFNKRIQEIGEELDSWKNDGMFYYDKLKKIRKFVCETDFDEKIKESLKAIMYSKNNE